MENRKQLEKAVIKVLKTLSDFDKISCKARIEDLALDSITWIQFFDRLEEKNIFVTDFASIYVDSMNIEYVYELIDLIENDLNRSNNS